MAKKPKPKLEICKMLTLSTAHISATTSRYITWEALSGWSDDYGFILYTLNPDMEKYPEDLRVLLSFARFHGCDYLRLDRDGPTLPDFPTHDW